MDTSKLSIEEKAFFFEEFVKEIYKFTNPDNVIEASVPDFLEALTKIGIDIQLVNSKEVDFEILKSVRREA